MSSGKTPAINPTVRNGSQPEPALRLEAVRLCQCGKKAMEAVLRSIREPFCRPVVSSEDLP